jgi:hypothetical protein
MTHRKYSMRRSFLLSLAALPLSASFSAHAGLWDKAKSVKQDLDKAANTPTKVSIGKGRLEDSVDDMTRVFAAFRKKIGTSPLMVYGASIGFHNDAHITYQSLYNPEKLESLHFVKGEIQGKSTKFTLTGNDVKVKDNVFDFDRIKLAAIPELVKTARAKTSEANKGLKTLGASVKMVQYWTKGKPTELRIIVTVASDDGKSTMDLLGDAVDSAKGQTIPKGASVGQLMADETGKVLGFRML